MMLPEKCGVRPWSVYGVCLTMKTSKAAVKETHIKAATPRALTSLPNPLTAIKFQKVRNSKRRFSGFILAGVICIFLQAHRVRLCGGLLGQKIAALLHQWSWALKVTREREDLEALDDELIPDDISIGCSTIKWVWIVFNYLSQTTSNWAKWTVFRISRPRSLTATRTAWT